MIPNSASLVVSTPALVLAEYVKLIKQEITEVKCVYDEGLSFESALEKFRADNQEIQNYTNVYPLFIFRRSTLRYPSAGQGRRSVTNYASYKVSNTDSKQYKVPAGEFDIEFMYITKSMQDMERFEVAYLGEEGISEIKSLEVDLSSEVGAKFPYYTVHEPLTEKRINVDNLYYKSLMGKVQVRGLFPVFRGSGKHINEIVLRIREFLGEVMVTTTIV